MFRQWIFAVAACAAFFLAQPAAGAAAVDVQEYEHEQLQRVHPCGYAGRQLSGLTQFFVHKWKATYLDLDPELLRRWLEFHDLLDEDPAITLARVYSSPFQPLVAVVAAYEFTSELDGKVLVQMHCVVPVDSRHMLRQYDPEALQVILGRVGNDA